VGGYTAIRGIRDRPGLRDLPIIPHTANAKHGDRGKGLAAGMNDHLGKPIDVAGLFKTLDRWAGPGSGRSRAAAGGRQDPALVADGLPTLPGIDREAGLKVILGRVDLYRRLLLRFRDQQRGFADDFAAALSAGDRDTATRLAHTLKGVAANLGARELSAAARELEWQCQDPDGATDSALQRVRTALDRVLSGLGALEVGSEAAPRGRTADPRSLAPVLREIHRLVAEDNGAAVDELDRLAPLLAGTELDGELRALVAAIGGDDFDTARGLLQALAGRAGIRL